MSTNLRTIRELAKNTTTKGGLYAVQAYYKKYGIKHIVNQTLPKRDHRAKYSYQEILESFFYYQMCGLTRFGQAEKFRDELSHMNICPMPSHDTLTRAFRKLSGSCAFNITFNKKGEKVINEVSQNQILNELILKVLRRIKAFPQFGNTLHIDTSLLFSQNVEAMTTFKKRTGYNPMVALINNYVVQFEGRNGNSSPSYELEKFLDQTLNHLSHHSITVNTFISDSAAFKKSIAKYFDNRKMTFLIRPRIKMLNQEFKDEFKDEKYWSHAELKVRDHRLLGECARIPFSFSKGNKKKYWIVIFRTRKSKKELLVEYREDKKSILSDKKYNYTMVLTNDGKTHPCVLIEKYNQRGTQEHAFHNLKQHFGWKYPPFQRVHDNEAFQMLAGISYNLYQAMVKKFSEITPTLKGGIEKNKFMDLFIHVMTFKYGRQLRIKYHFHSFNGIDYTRIMRLTG